MIMKTKGVFRFAMDEELVEKVIRFGKRFKAPSKRVMRLHRAKNGERMFSAEEIRAMLKKAGPQLHCMILLGVNLGYGNSDISSLPIKALDLQKGWAVFPRPKTGIPRRGKLWLETVKALRRVIANRPTPKDEADAGLVFITKYGQRWVKIVTQPETDGDKEENRVRVTCDDAVAKAFRKVMKSLNLDGHRGFYCLRHTFATAGGESEDQIAVNAIMGHAAAGDDETASIYREKISDRRLEAVTTFVHDWLFPRTKKTRGRRSTKARAL